MYSCIDDYHKTLAQVEHGVFPMNDNQDGHKNET